MSGAWRRLDLAGGGLQEANREIARTLRRRGIAYGLWLLFPAGAHRFYLAEALGGLVYVAATAALLAFAVAGWTVAALVASAVLVSLASHRLRLLGKPLGIARIDASENAILLQFVPNPPLEPARIIKLIQTKRNYKLAGQDRLRIEVKLPELKARVAEIRRVFAELG